MRTLRSMLSRRPGPRGARPAGLCGRREADDHAERLDLGVAARIEAREGLRQDEATACGFKVLQGGSDLGVNDVAHGRVTLGMSSRDPLPSDPGGLVFNRIARDGSASRPIPRNPLASMSQDTDPGDLLRPRPQLEPGAWREDVGPIDLIVRNPASGTQDAFQNIFMGQNLRIASSASQRPSNGRVQQSIASNQNAIGYVDFNFTSGLHTIPYKGVACSAPEREVRRSTAASVTSGWSRAASPRARRRPSIKWIQLGARRARSSRRTGFR